jgi:two-component system, cell cycle sensor histidine kinase and response regulator CckA
VLGPSEIEGMLQLLQVSISKHAILKMDLGKDLPSVRAAPAQIRQVIMNLVTNAAEAIGERDGVIRITTERLKVGRNLDAIPVENLPEGNYLGLEISDTGCGMTPELQLRAFDHFSQPKALAAASASPLSKASYEPTVAR